MSIKSKIKHLLFLVLFSSLFVGELFSQNFLNFDLDYVDYSGTITGNVGDTVTIPVQAIFFQDEGYCDTAYPPGLCGLLNAGSAHVHPDTARHHTNDVLEFP